MRPPQKNIHSYLNRGDRRVACERCDRWFEPGQLQNGLCRECDPPQAARLRKLAARYGDQLDWYLATSPELLTGGDEL